MMDPKGLSESQHEQFYRYITQAYDKPRYTLHYKTDAPLNIRSIFYVPEMVKCSICLIMALSHSTAPLELGHPHSHSSVLKCHSVPICHTDT